MYLPLGQNIVVKKQDIIGIFDLDTSTVKKPTRDFLKKAEQSSQVINVSFDLPNSFVLCVTSEEGKKNEQKEKQKNTRVYITPVSSATLGRRVL